MILVPFHSTAMFLARIVMPRSFSRSLESRIRSPVSWLARYCPLCRNRQSTSVVLPWSTWAMIATLRMSLRRTPAEAGVENAGAGAGVMLEARWMTGNQGGRANRRKHKAASKTRRGEYPTGERICLPEGMETMGIEPTTPALQRRCSPN